MSTKRKRGVISATSFVTLKPKVRLQFDTLRQRFVVLGPEHVYWPDESSLAILQKLDGIMCVKDIVRALADEFDAPVEMIDKDVREFLQSWADEQLIKIKE